MEPLKPGDPEILGPWSITARLATTGTGNVYLGVKGVSGVEQAAIKVIDQASNEVSTLEKLRNESLALEQIDDQNVVKLKGSDHSGSLRWIATEYINGPTLETYLAQNQQPLSELEWFRLAENIFHGLKAIHAAGVIHKDIKPSNIILGETGAKIIDFGISHVPGLTEIASPGDFEGSRLYSAPENFSRRNSEEMDVFSAAVTLGYAARLESIWHGKNEMQISESMTKDEPNLEGITPLQLELITPMLAKLASERPSSQIVHAKILEYLAFLTTTSTKPEALEALHAESKAKHSSKWRRSGAILLVLAFIAIVGIQKIDFRGTSIPLSQCRINLKSGNLDQALQLCQQAISEGRVDAKTSLARTLMAKGSKKQARVVLESCRKTNIACLSDYAYFFESSTAAIQSLKKAYLRGDREAAWRIGVFEMNNGETSTAVSWYRKGSITNNAVANLLLGIHYSRDLGDYKTAITFIKKAQFGDFSGAPNFLVLDHPIERFLEPIYTLSKDAKGKELFYSNCARNQVIFCMSVLALDYLDKERFADAQYWALKGAELNDGGSLWVLARVAAHKNSLRPEGQIDPATDNEIVDWYSKSAKAGYVRGMENYAISYFFGMGGLSVDLDKSCYWLQKTMAAISDRSDSYKKESSDMETYKRASQFFEFQNCQSILLGETPKLFDSQT